MAGGSPQERLGLSCPDEGDFYICDKAKTRFVGCCTSDPCKDDKGECPDDDLYVASFDETKYGDIPEQQCAGTANWFTCTGSDPPFMGCCDVDGCSKDGCPRDKLRAAKLSDNEDDAKAFLPRSATAATPSTKAASSDRTSKATPAPSATSMGTLTATPSAARSLGATATPSTDAAAAAANTGGLSEGTIVGIGAGGGALLLVVLGSLVLWCARKMRRSRSQRAHDYSLAQAPQVESDLWTRAKPPVTPPPGTSPAGGFFHTEYRGALGAGLMQPSTAAAAAATNHHRRYNKNNNNSSRSSSNGNAGKQYMPYSAGNSRQPSPEPGDVNPPPSASFLSAGAARPTHSRNPSWGSETGLVASQEPAELETAAAAAAARPFLGGHLRPPHRPFSWLNGKHSNR